MTTIISGDTGIDKVSNGAVDLTTDVSGILPQASGGTNSTATPTAGGVGYGTGTAHAYTAAGTTGQVLQSNGNAPPSWVTVASGLPGFTTVILNASTTWTVPSGVTRAVVTVVGGGGGGGGYNGSNGQNGGQGGLAVAYITGLSGSVTVTVGTGGSGGAATGGSGANGGAGNTSSFGAYMSATGGGGGFYNGSSNQAGAAGTGTVTTGTAILTSLNSANATLPYLGNNNPYSLAQSAPVYSASLGYVPGGQGYAGVGAGSTGKGGVGGVVMIQY